MVLCGLLITSTAASAKEYACVEDAVRDSTLLHNAAGRYERSEFIVAGVSILEQRVEGENLIVSAYVCPATVDTDVAPPAIRHRTYIPVRVTYRVTSLNEYEEIEYVRPRDGFLLKPDAKKLFSEDIYMRLFYSNVDERVEQQRLVGEDADMSAELCIAGDSNARSLARYFLQTGSNPGALDVIAASPIRSGDRRYPYFEGDVIQFDTRFRLIVEGEKSFSGILTFESEDLHGNPLSYCKVKVEGDDLIILDGSLQ
jgi:hypothetical protein